MPMTSDKILDMFFDLDRWTNAIEKGVVKDIDKGWLIRLTEPSVRKSMAASILSGRYAIAPPHAALIPKDNPGEFRTVYVNEPADRILLSIANDLLFDLTPDMVHPSCKSYIKGTGCGQVVRQASRAITDTPPAPDGHVGWKSDLSKYFDSVPLPFIEEAFDRVEERHGHSALIDVLRRYYRSDLYFDEHGVLKSAYQSLKQGCAVGSWLADVLLYDIDAELSSLNGYYVRYSDDMLFIGPDHPKAMSVLQQRLAAKSMRLNPKKVELLEPGRWFKFLGYSIKGDMISLSSTRIKSFQREIEARTVRRRGVTPSQAVKAVNRFLYIGDGTHSWATQVLPAVNVREDIDTLNAYVMDCLRAVMTGRLKTGGLGYSRDRQEGCVLRGAGRNVTANRRKTPARLEGYLSIGCMQNALRCGRAVYDTLVRTL